MQMMLKLTTQCRQLLIDFERDNSIQILSLKVPNNSVITIQYIDGLALKQSDFSIQNNRIIITDVKMLKKDIDINLRAKPILLNI